MPTYQYACKECGHAFDEIQSFSDEALTECPECDGRLRKVFNAVGVVFKGSGFYRTDSRAASSEAGSSSGDTKSESKGESKKESTSDSSKSSGTSESSGSSSASSTSTKSPQPTAG